MVAFVDVYNALKEVISLAKKAKNQEVIERLIELQELFFELREQNDLQLNKIKKLENQIIDFKKVVANEKSFKFNTKGFFTNEDDAVIIPYCSRCWMVDKKLVLLSQYGNWFNYACPDCKAEICVMDENGKSLEARDKIDGGNKE